MNTAPEILDQRVTEDTFRIATHLPIPGLGVLPVNSFLIRSREPVLIDTGVVALGEGFFDRISALIEPKDLRYIWLTHTDNDHIGSLARLLEAAPQATVVTTFLGMGKLGLASPLPPERVFLLNPGQALDVGDRKLLAVKPPSYDAPETTGLFDGKSRILFSADSFGTLLTAPAESLPAVATAERQAGLATWTSVDAPWLRSVEQGAFEASVQALRALEPAQVLSSHAPPAPGMLETLIADLSAARSAAPFVGPDQAAMIQMMAGAAA